MNMRPSPSNLRTNGLIRAFRRSVFLGSLLIIGSGLPANESYPLPVSITSLKLPAAHALGNDSNPIYTYSMSDATPAPELLFINDRAYLIWTDSNSNGRISLLKPDLSSVEKDLVQLRNRRIGDAVTDGKSITLLTLEWQTVKNGKELHTAHLESYSTTGRALFRTKVVGTLNYDKEGSQGILSAFSTFNLGWSGKEYATYFTTYRKWDDGVVHQSEYLALFDRNGKPMMDGNRPAGWTWNVSHSFRPRISWDGQRFLMSTVGDAYPRGLVIQSYPSTGREVAIEVPKAAPGETYQDVVISTGDVYGKDGRGWIVFDSRLNRKDYDIGMIRTDKDGKPGSTIWITGTSEARERIPRIQPLGQNLLLAWAVDGSGNSPQRAWNPVTGDMKTQLAVVDPDGEILVPAFYVPARIRGATRLFQFPNGDVGWINDATAQARQMEIVRISIAGPNVTDNTNTDTNTDITDTVDPDATEFDPSLNLPVLQSALRGDAGAVQSFLARGANPNASHEGWFAIHYAAYYGHSEVCKILLEAGAKPDTLIEGWSALQLAESRGHSNVVEVLKPVSRSRNRTMNSMPGPGESLSRPLQQKTNPVRKSIRTLEKATEIGPPRSR